ncbi:MAG: proprotein convertase P-domain-containing protein, partial [Deltaproteobacteria bacterium]|nr:proprotein convertase P-domain-containing protein [Deltaproteobacteria bacterium]
MNTGIALRNFLPILLVLAAAGGGLACSGDGDAEDVALGDALEATSATPAGEPAAGDPDGEKAAGSVKGALGCTPPTGRLVITEVMIHPVKVADLYGEWIEIYNPFAEAVDLKDWRIRDASGEGHVILTSVVVNGGSYVVLCANSDSGTNGGVTCNYQYTAFTLKNDVPDQVTLADVQNTDVYTVSWTGSAPAGASVAIEHPFLDVSGAALVFGAGGTLDPAANWSVSTAVYGGAGGDRGTPGTKNIDVWRQVESPGCSDGKVCTWDICEMGTCANPWKTGCCTSQEAAPNECNDGNDCTTEGCDVPNNQCTYANIANCCKVNADCLDDNPCNSDWCAWDASAKGYRCRHSSHNIVPGCCYAPPVNNPATGLPWDPADATTWALPGTAPNGVPDQREAHGATQCDDKKYCTPNGCDATANFCKYGAPAPGCCDWPTECDDGDGCTYDYCENHVCTHYRKTPNCCETDQFCKDTFYENECWIDKCVAGTCRHLFNPANCCVNDAYCAEPPRADNNPCTDEKCILVNPATGERECQHIFMTDCKMGLPYQETFNTAESLAKIGWSIIDFGTKAVAHWVLATIGELGPDKFLRFVWNPTTPMVQSVAYTPKLDATKANPAAPDGDFYNTTKNTTLQWRMVYKHSPGGGPVTIRAVVTDDEWVSWTPLVWEKSPGVVVNAEWTRPTTDEDDNVVYDVEYGIYSFQLPASVKFSPSLRLGFMVDTGNETTFNMDNLQVDDVRLAAGLPNRFVSAQILKCDPNKSQCELPTEYTKVCDTKPFGTSPAPLCDGQSGRPKVRQGEDLPELYLGACQWYKVMACFRDVDATDSTWNFYGYPAGWLEGSPLDSTPFVFAKGGCTQDLGSFCPTGQGAGAFMCAFEIKPACQEGHAGTYRTGIVTQDEYDPARPQHSIFQSLTKMSVNVLLESGYIVWSPNGSSDASAVALRDGIIAAGRKAQILRNILIVQDLSKYSGVFAVLGVHGRYHKVSADEGAKLAGFLDGGGKVYVEGGDFWYTGGSGAEQVKLSLHDYFGVTVKSDGEAKTAGPVGGRNFLWGMGFDLSQNAALNSWNDQIAHTPGGGGREVLRIGDDKAGWATAVTREAAGLPKYRTGASSFAHAAMLEKGLGTRNELVAKWVYFFENGYPACTQNAQCNDFEVCTDDSCGPSFACVNAAVPNCIECMNDLYKWDEVSPSCGEDQACDVAKGYCVDIEKLVYTSKTVTACSPKTFGTSPTARACQAAVVSPGVVKDLQVKVQVDHSYRGDVKLSLKGPAGSSIELKRADPADARAHVYETYDLGVPLPAGVSFDPFVDGYLNGVWTLTASDDFPPMFNGAIQSWRLYGKYEPIGCTEAVHCPDTPCMNKECVAEECKYTAFECDDADPCTSDSCDPVANECVHKAKSSCACDNHSDCESPDDVCLKTGTDEACLGADPCECRSICPADEPTCRPYYVTGGLPLTIPDDDLDGVSRVRTIVANEASGVVRKLWVKVQTTHTSMGDLVASLCHLGECVTLHRNSGGNSSGFWKVFEYDVPADGAGALAVFDGMQIRGDWTLKLVDNIAGDEGKLATWTLYAASVDCYHDWDCDDGNACTVDTCESPVDGGTCKHTAIQCTPSADSCSADQCDPADGVCKPHQQPDGTPCDDGAFCTAYDTCQAGACVPGDPRNCSEVGDPATCKVGECNEDQDMCVPVQAAAGATCDDLNPCTSVDTCDAGGTCVGAAQPPVCICDSTKPPETQCQDGNLCNGTMKCVANWCVVDQGPKDCGDAAAECRTMRCIPSTGACVEQNAQPGTPCDDGSYCTIGDTCLLGAVCNPGGQRDCSALGGDCAQGVCDDVQDACVAQNAADGTACERGDGGCSVDTCQAGTCTFDHDIACATQDCNSVVCQPRNWNGYECVYGPIPDGTACTPDLDPCTDDKCLAGHCLHTQSDSCAGAPCGGGHTYDAGDGMCGVEDSCVGGLAGYPNGTCTRTCADCAKGASGVINLPIDEKIPGGTVSSVALASPKPYAEQVFVKVRVEHDYVGDLVIDVIDPKGWVHTVWNNIGGSRHDFSNTYDLSFPIPYGGNPESGVPMCALRGEGAPGTWWLRVLDTGTGNSGVLREWKVYVKPSDATDLNLGHRCTDAIDLGDIDINPAITVLGTTACALNGTSSSCGGQNGPERLYKFTLFVPKRITTVLRQPDRDLILFIKKHVDGVACDASNLCSQPGAVCYCSQQTGVWGPTNKADEKIDVQLQPGVYYVGVDTNGDIYDTGTFSFDIRIKNLMADGEPCSDPVEDQDIDCLSRHCQNGYCCQAGDCCPSHEWTVPPDGTNPETIKGNADWISANVTADQKCPAQYREVPVCTTPATCQGERYDAMCVNHMCVKTKVDDDAACTDSVESDLCGYWKSVYCGSVGPVIPGAQTEPPCPTWCEQDQECDGNAHCDPVGDPTIPDSPPGAQDMTCQPDRPDGATCNEEDAPPPGPGGPDDSDCISGHCRNGYCCESGDCCPTDDLDGAAVCPASYQQDPVCAESATCEGYRYDKTCIDKMCGTYYVDDDCACADQVAFSCGFYLPKQCPSAPACPAG